MASRSSGGPGATVGRRPDRGARAAQAVLGGGIALVVAIGSALLAASPASGAPRLHPAPSLTRARPPSRGLGGLPVNVLIDPRAPLGPQVPQDFLGLSFEAESLPRIAGYAGRGDLVELLKSLGPGVMRFGGFSADRTTAFLAGAEPLPAWARVAITPADLAGIAALSRATGWRVLLTVNLGHYDPAAAGREAHAAQAALGANLAGVALGNEPDRYVANRLRPAGWAFAAYRLQAEVYRAAIAAAAPGVQIVGPDPSSGPRMLTWVRGSATIERPALLTGHYYPLSRCGGRPTLGDLLSPFKRTSESGLLARLAAISRTSGLPLRLDETNNVSCRGEPGVSNVFGSALWAVDYLARVMTRGLTGLNFHDLIGSPRSYSPLVAPSPAALASGALHANPEWYALLMARQLLGGQPVRANVANSDRRLTAAAFLGPDGRLQIVLVNFASPGAQRLLVRLRVPGRFGPGPILRLTAPSPSARAGVVLGGRNVGPAGAWTPPTRLPRVTGGRGSLVLGMPPSSAALITLPPTPASPSTIR